MFGADEVFPLIVFLLAHVGCVTIARRLQCASEVIDSLINRVFHHAHDAVTPYFGLVDDEGTLSELRYYCTAMQARSFVRSFGFVGWLVGSFVRLSLIHI